LRIIEIIVRVIVFDVKGRMARKAGKEVRLEKLEMK